MVTNRIAIYIDGSNLSKAIRAAGYRLDYDKVLSYFSEQGYIVSAKYFTALPPRTVHADVRRLIDRLSYHGWNIVSRETKDLLSSDGLFKMKGNMDVDIAVHAMCVYSQIDRLILFSGDGDFVPLVSALQERGVKVTAISHLANNDSCMIADELRRQVDQFIDLKTMSHKWSMEAGDRRQPI
jgi:uncharacterized LabA/DUF88 family protein